MGVYLEVEIDRPSGKTERFECGKADGRILDVIAPGNRECVGSVEITEDNLGEIVVGIARIVHDLPDPRTWTHVDPWIVNPYYKVGNLLMYLTEFARTRPVRGRITWG